MIYTPCRSETRAIDPADAYTWSDLTICGAAHELVYRLRSVDDELLYVGVTWTPKERWKRHRKTKPWWADVHHVEVDCYPSDEIALAVEWAAIKTESPRFNIHGAVRR